MKPSTLKMLREKYPKFTPHQLKVIVNYHLRSMERRISNNTTFDMTVPKFGRIHTHGNAKNKAYELRIKKFTKRHRRLNKFSDNTLLF